MNRVFLFGGWLDIQNGQVAQPSSSSLTGTWKAPFDPKTGAVALEANLTAYSTYRLDIALPLRFERVAPTSDDWKLASIQEPQSTSRLRIFKAADTTPPQSSLVLSWGPLSISDKLTDVGLSASDDLDIVFQPDSRNDATGLPFDLFSQGPARLDLAQLRVEFRDSSFAAEVCAARDVLISPHKIDTFAFLAATLESRRLELRLDSNPGDLTIVLDGAGPAQSLPMHVELPRWAELPSADNPLLRPLFLTEYALKVKFVPGNRNGPMRIAEMLAVSSADSTQGPMLTTEGWRDTENAAVQWKLDRPLILHIRSGTDSTPATFLIAPHTDEQAPYLQASGSRLIMHSDVREARNELTGGLRLALRSQRRVATTSVPNGLVPEIASDGTAPFTVVPNNTSHRVGIAKAGKAYFQRTGETVITHSFEAPDLRLPLLPPSILAPAQASLQADHIRDLTPPQPVDSPLWSSSIHESLMVESPDPRGTTVPLQALFDLQKDLGKPVDPQIGAYSIKRTYGPVSVSHEQTEHTDYAFIDDAGALDGPLTVTLNTGTNATVQLMWPPMKQTGWPVALVKLTRRFCLQDIAVREQRLLGMKVGGLDFLSEIVHPDIARADWTGLMLFQVGLDVRGFPILADLSGSTLTLAYIALTPPKTAGGAISISARVRRVADSSTLPDPLDPTQEVRLLTRLVDISWFDSTLLHFQTLADLTFSGFFGLTHKKGDERTLTIEGALDKDSGTVRFVGQLSSPLEVLPAGGGFGPIRQVELSGAEIAYTAPDKVTIRLKGGIVPQAFAVSGVDFGAAIERIVFDGLGIRVPALSGSDPNVWRWLTLDYPSIRLDLNLPHIDLGLIGLKLQSLGIGLGGVDWGRDLLWREMASVPGPSTPEWLRAFVFGLRLELMRLPELSLVQVDRLSIDFSMALAPFGNTWNLSNLRVAVGAFGFDHFRLDLLRFLVVSADRVSLQTVTYRDPDNPTTTRQAPWLLFDDVEVEILGKTIVKGLTLVIFTTHEGQTGLFCYAPTNIDAPGILSIDWILIGHNVSPSEALAESLVKLDAATTDGENQSIRDAIRRAVDPKTLEILPRPAGSRLGEWVFAGGFSVFGDVLYGKLLFQDNRYYGVCLRGGLLLKILGVDTAISVLYIKASSPAEDRFVVSVRVPTVVLPAFTFFGGVVTFDIAVNGSFMIDVGFPALTSSGARDWGRSFGTIVGIFQGSGGIYIAKRTAVIPSGSTLQLAGGYAIQFGLGASFGGGIFRVYVTIGLYAVLEGLITFRQSSGSTDIDAITVVGAVGILIRGVGELDWWIIALRVEVTASAEARTTLQWQRGQPTYLSFDFDLAVSASAEACIGGGWFRICKGIGVSLSIPFHESVQIGNG